MKRPHITALLTLLILSLALRGDGLPAPRMPQSPTGSPPRMLWAWEQPTDLRALDTSQAGVAFLAGRLFLDREVHPVGRHQPILVPNHVFAIAVVRIEARRGFADSEALRFATTQELLLTAELPGIHGLQIDFDAAPTQQAFYTDVLHRVRSAMPRTQSLSITALVSWCAQSEGWLHKLPIDQAVPMHFRLGQHTGAWPVREPLCSAADGISTDEPGFFRASVSRQTYIFTPGSWTPAQIAAINHGQLPTYSPERQ